MDHRPLSELLLLIEDNAEDAELIMGALARVKDPSYRVEWVRQLCGGIERLDAGGIAAVLVNLFLPDSNGIQTLEKLIVTAPHVPILVLSDDDDETIATQVTRLGATDYLLNGYFDSYTLHRAVRNVIERKSAEEALFVERDRAQTTLNCIGDGVLSTDLSGNVTYLNIVAEQMTGWSRDEAVGRPFSEVFKIIDQVKRIPSRNPVELAIRQDRRVGLAANCNLVRRDGLESEIEDSAAPIHDQQGRVTGAVIVFHDVSAARAMVLRMSYSAEHDFLTDLPNRMLMLDRLTQAIARANRHGNQVAVLFLDLDGFKQINDSLGHTVGDKLLQSVAARLTTCVRNSDTVCRQGGDEFVILLSEVKKAEDAAAVSATKMLAALAAPYKIEQHEVHVSASIGMASYPQDGQDAETLLKHADAAMYYAKEGGRNQYHFFSQGR